MSVPGSTSLETPPVTPPAQDPPEPEGTTVVGGQRMAPIGAVIEERRARQEAAREAERLRTENESLRRKAENYDVVEPYLPLLATHPKVTGKPAAPPTPPAQDPELIAAAEALGFYNDDGTPDTSRAAKAKGFFSGLVKNTVKEEVAPLAQTTARTAASSLRERAYQVVDKQGRPFAAKENIDAVLNELPPEYQADPQVMQLALMIARGMGTETPAAGEPLYTEGAGGARPGGGASLSSLERAAARARGLSEQDWVKQRDTKNDSWELE
jgi:hypothetical protein